MSVSVRDMEQTLEPGDWLPTVWWVTCSQLMASIELKGLPPQITGHPLGLQVWAPSQLPRQLAFRLKLHLRLS